MTMEIFMWALSGALGLVVAMAGFWGKSVIGKLSSIDNKLSELAHFQGGTEARLSDYKRRLDVIEDRIQELAS